MIKARLVPVYFSSGRDDEFTHQLNGVKNLLAEEAEFLEPVVLGSPLVDADAILFPQLLGEAFKKADVLKKVKVPLLIVTSEFGNVSMWDWEIVSFLKAEGIKIFSPYNLELTKTICRSLAVKRQLRDTKFLLFQDNPGEGMQASIFKRFYWWEEKCSDLIRKKFGITLVKKSLKRLAETAKQIPDTEAEEVWKNCELKTEGVSQRALSSAVKMYIAIKREIEKDQTIRGAGMNCLNESFYSDTTPCLAWNMLFEESGFIWACEGDTMVLTTKYIVQKALKCSIMMSNIYPFLMGMAALKHEKIDAFPDVDDPENHFLVAHCGYLGVVPTSFSTEWVLRPKVLSIVDDNATAIDARLPTGALTLTKLDPTLTRLMVVEGMLEGYAQYPDSDCRNGAIVRVQNAKKLMNKFYSHHYLLVPGHKSVEMDLLAKVMDLEVDEI